MEGPQRTVVTASVLARGSDLYKINCVACHGLDGRGKGPQAGTLDPPPRDHTVREYMDRLSDTDIATSIVAGGAEKGFPNMPASPHIRGDDLAALVAFVRTLSRGEDGVPEVEFVPPA